jgi:hypothetical protein
MEVRRCWQDFSTAPLSNSAILLFNVMGLPYADGQPPILLFRLAPGNSFNHSILSLSSHRPRFQLGKADRDSPQAANSLRLPILKGCESKKNLNAPRWSVNLPLERSAPCSIISLRNPPVS